MKSFYPLNFPWIPGRDFSGIVEAVGEDIGDYQVGDEVYGDCVNGGTYAEYLVVTPEKLSFKPKTLSFTEAASVPVAAETAWQSLFKYAHLESGKKILVHGGGGAVGAYVIQFALQGRC